MTTNVLPPFYGSQCIGLHRYTHAMTASNKNKTYCEKNQKE